MDESKKLAMRLYSQDYYKKNREKILLRAKNKQYCDICGKYYHNNKAIHDNSLKHIKNIKKEPIDLKTFHIDFDKL